MLQPSTAPSTAPSTLTLTSTANHNRIDYGKLSLMEFLKNPNGVTVSPQWVTSTVDLTKVHGLSRDFPQAFHPTTPQVEEARDDAAARDENSNRRVPQPQQCLLLREVFPSRSILASRVGHVIEISDDDDEDYSACSFDTVERPTPVSVNVDHITSADWKNEDDDWASLGADDNDNDNGDNTAPDTNFPLLDDIAVLPFHIEAYEDDLEATVFDKDFVALLEDSISDVDFDVEASEVDLEATVFGKRFCPLLDDNISLLDFDVEASKDEFKATALEKIFIPLLEDSIQAASEDDEGEEEYFDLLGLDDFDEMPEEIKNQSITRALAATDWGGFC
jgi:hypothetical protein